VSVRKRAVALALAAGAASVFAVPTAAHAVPEACFTDVSGVHGTSICEVGTGQHRVGVHCIGVWPNGRVVDYYRYGSWVGVGQFSVGSCSRWDVFSEYAHNAWVERR
jgi:hypothetical protein